MTKPIVIHPTDLDEITWPGGGRGRRMVSPAYPGSKNLIMGIIYVEPGKSPHRWHNHVYDKADDFEIIYPKDFEEAYMIIKGNGIVYWKTGDKINQAEVKEGDVVYFPPGMPEHQLVNTGDELMIVVYAGSPPTTIRKIK